MPTIPKIQKMTANSVEILNAIRAQADAEYQNRIPIATQENLREVGNAMMQYRPAQNTFLNALVNRIARVIISSKSYQNPLREFKRGIMEYGETVAEYFVNIAKAHQFDPAVAEKEWMKREIPDVQGVFHTMNYQNFYKVTISDRELRQAFLSQDGVTDLIARIVDSLYTGSEYDEFLIMKQLIVDAAQDGKMYPVQIPAISAANAKEIVTIIKSISNDMAFMKAKYNSMGVLTATPKTDQILILDSRFDAVIDVEVLASAFNMEKAEFMGRRILIDDFADLTGVVAAIVDSDWFMVFDNILEFTENYNGEGLYWQYWYHCWKTFSNSPFANAILFTTDTVQATAVTITPAAPSTTKGQQIQFQAVVSGTGYIPQDVSWSVTGQQSQDTKINRAGLLTVAADETATSLTVKAISGYNPSISKTVTVTVGA